MDSLTQELIARQKNSLHRAPPPRPPQGKPKNFIQDTENEAQTSPFQFKLKKTGFRESLISEDLVIHKDVVSDDPPSEAQSVIAKKKALFEAQESENCNWGLKPKPKPKPKPVVRPEKEDKENTTKPCTDSCSSNNEQAKMENDAIENVVFDDSRVGTTLRPLPTLQSLGKPPLKRPKPAHLRNSLEKFNEDDIVVAPRRTTLRSDAEETDAGLDVSVDAGEDFYDDVEEELKDQLLGNRKQEEYNKAVAQDQTQVQGDSVGIPEEFYDDVEEVTAKANGINSQQEQSSEQIWEENYDDINTVAEEVHQLNNNNDFNEGVSEEFGEEFYEPLMENTEDEGVQHTGSESPPKNKPATPQAPSIPNRQEDQKKGDTKEREKKDKKEIEMQKKKEKEEQKKMKEEQKKREREEREEKKKREREDKELRKKHKIKVGCEGRGVGVAKNDFSGDGKFELPAKEGDSLFVISEENCPPGKWLVKNSDGHLGYVPTELIKLQVDSHGNRISMTINEDLYEDVDQYQSGSLGVPSTPPPVPSAHPGKSAGVEPIEEEAEDEDFYDDIGGQEAIDDDFYEELPADQ